MTFSKITLTGFLIAVFVGGIVLGRLSITPSYAQGFPNVRAARIAQLGSLIDQMQRNIDEVQRNLKALREVKEALGAGERTEGVPKMLQEVPKIPVK